jgi:molybdate-binding protein
MYIKQIALSNIRGFADLQFELTRPNGTFAGWTVFTGDHRGVAEAIRNGWADAGVCVRLAGEEAGLGFMTVRKEPYDLCYLAEQEDDPRVQALIKTVRSRAFRSDLSALPGYHTEATGAVCRTGGAA